MKKKKDTLFVWLIIISIFRVVIRMCCLDFLGLYELQTNTCTMQGDLST